MTQAIQAPQHPIPLDIRKELPDPMIPWGISKRIFNAMQSSADTSNQHYKKVQVLPSDPEWRFVWRYFHNDKPTNYGIKRIYCIHERHQQQAFELNLSSTEREATKFPPTWQKEPRAQQRAQTINRWKEVTQIFSPFQTRENDGRRRSWEHAKVLPLWHGSSEEVCHSIAESGFVYFGKKTLIGAQSGDPKSTDEGYFGSGIYFTNSARYASDIYSEGHLVLAWVSMREPFPVVGDPLNQDMQTLKGHGAYKQYNAHYVPVNPTTLDSRCAIYHPTKQNQTPLCDEVVIFHKSQALGRFWVELEVEVPGLKTLSDDPQCVEDLIPHFFQLLQNPHVDKDKRLRNFLSKELSTLLTMEADDYLEERQEALYPQLTQLLDQTGKVNRTLSRTLTGSKTQVSTPPPTKPSPPVQKTLPAVPPKVAQPYRYQQSSLPQVQNLHITKPQNTLPSIAFGKAKWNTYFGDVGVEPPLPSNINEILRAPCPFWSGKRVEETHMLVLIPETVNGQPFTLDLLSILIKKPKKGKKTKYKFYSNYVKNELGNRSSASHWTLMTRDVVPNSRKKTYDAQKNLIASLAQRSGQPYELPLALDAAACILMEYVRTGKKLYTDNKKGAQYTYTLCQEKVHNNKWLTAIGGFAAGGLGVYCNVDGERDINGVAGSRKFF